MHYSKEEVMKQLYDSVTFPALIDLFVEMMNVLIRQVLMGLFHNIELVKPSIVTLVLYILS